MKKLFFKILGFLLIGLLVGEAVARYFVLTSDIPRRMIDEFGIQKYLPNQEGYFIGGDHKWHVNELGWPGDLPASYDNVITIIGDSFIENFMNPNECRQAMILKHNLPDLNFFEAARSGVSLIESLEIATRLDSLNPKYQLIYMGETDFEESIAQIKRHEDILQVDLEKGEVLKARMVLPGLKNALYNWKFLYFLYNRFPLRFDHLFAFKKQGGDAQKAPKKHRPDPYPLYKELLLFIKSHYDTSDMVFVFRPSSPKQLSEMTRDQGFTVIALERENDVQWVFDHDHHWTCTGHNFAAQQVTRWFKTKPETRDR